MTTIPASLDVDGWNRHLQMTGQALRVELDGQDVTEVCYRYAFHANPPMVDGFGVGDVFIFRRNAEGNLYLGPDGEVAKETRTGQLRVSPGHIR